MERSGHRRANVAFSAIAVPAGTPYVSRVYRPTSLAAGAVVSTLSGVVLLILARAFRISQRSQNTAAHHGPDQPGR